MKNQHWNGLHLVKGTLPSPVNMLMWSMPRDNCDDINGSLVPFMVIFASCAIKEVRTIYSSILFRLKWVGYWIALVTGLIKTKLDYPFYEVGMLEWLLVIQNF